MILLYFLRFYQNCALKVPYKIRIVWRRLARHGGRQGSKSSHSHSGFETPIAGLMVLSSGRPPAVCTASRSLQRAPAESSASPMLPRAVAGTLRSRLSLLATRPAERVTRIRYDGSTPVSGLSQRRRTKTDWARCCRSQSGESAFKSVCSPGL